MCISHMCTHGSYRAVMGIKWWIILLRFVNIKGHHGKHNKIYLSRVVCRAAQETWGARQTSVYFTGVKKTPF